jgi:hypothetical protein
MIQEADPFQRMICFDLCSNYPDLGVRSQSKDGQVSFGLKDETTNSIPIGK